MADLAKSFTKDSRGLKIKKASWKTSWPFTGGRGFEGLCSGLPAGFFLALARLPFLAIPGSSLQSHAWTSGRTGGRGLEGLRLGLPALRSDPRLLASGPPPGRPFPRTCSALATVLVPMSAWN